MGAMPTFVTSPYSGLDRPAVLAHQGDSRYYPANTMLAFVSAVEKGADAIESDIHMTKDGHIVLCHDATVDRTSNGNGGIAEMTLAELKALDFGYWFSQDGGQTYPFRDRGVTIPTLAEVLTTLSDVRLNLDVKPAHGFSLSELIRQIFQYEAAERVMVASFHHPVLKQFRAMNSVIATSASPRETAELFVSQWIPIQAIRRPAYRALQVPLRAGPVTVVTKRFLSAAHNARVPVHVWTVDDEAEMMNLYRLGVDGIVSNDPRLAVETRLRVYERMASA